MDKNIQLKLEDSIKTALGLKHNPTLICTQSRSSCEAMLKEIYKEEIGPVPDKSFMLDKLLKSIKKERPEVIPISLEALITTVQIYGNIASHPQENLEQLNKTHATMVESALSGICNWFFNEYYQLGVDIKSFHLSKNNSKNATLDNYEELIRLAFDDKILELDEFESLIAAKKNMQIDFSDAEKIERTVAKELLGIELHSLKDALSPINLTSFEKYDKKSDDFPEWVLSAIDSINDSENPEWQTYLHNYFTRINSKNTPSSSHILPILGAWQGWYFQSSAKTYFDLFFIAKNASEIVGISIEPNNPTTEFGPVCKDEPLFYASISGNLSDEILFNYKKKYIGASVNVAEIKYEGVVIDEGKYFEGEWSIRSLVGHFNAMKSKSLLPIRIFNTDEKVPIVKTQFLNNLNKLISSWFVQFRGKSTQFVILHLLELENKIYANIVFASNNSMEILYYISDDTRFYQNEVNLTLVDNGKLDLKNTISFIIDWNNKSISGTIRNEEYKIRSLRGVRF